MKRLLTISLMTLISLGTLSSLAFAQQDTSLEPVGPADSIPASAISLLPVEKAVISNVNTMLVASCPTCEGGSIHTFVEVKFHYSSCNALLPVQQGVSISEGKVQILLAAFEVVTRQSLVGLCATEEYTHSIDITGEYDKSDMNLVMLTVPK